MDRESIVSPTELLTATGAAEPAVLVSPEQVMREREGTQAAIEVYTKVGEGGTVVPVLEPPSAAEKTAIEDRSFVAPDRNP